MKISELIKELQRVLESDGDIDVLVYPYDGQMNAFPAEEVSEVNNTSVVRWNDAIKDWDKEPCDPFVVIT